MKKTLLCFTTAVLACAAPAAQADASEFHTGIPVASGWLMNENAGGSGFGAASVTGYSGRAGQFHGKFSATDAVLDASEIVRFFCVDLAQHANTGPSLYDAALWDGDPTSTLLRRLYNAAYPGGASGDFWDEGAAAPSAFGTFANSDQSTAFQLAVWEIVFEPANLDLAAGTFKWTGSAANAAYGTAQGWLSAVRNDNGSDYEAWTLYRFNSGSYQDYVAATHSGPERIEEVPEPGSLALAALGIAALGATGRRRRRG